MAVWFRIRVKRRVGRQYGGEGSGGSLWATFSEDVGSTSFYIDDGSGERAKVTAAGPNVYAGTYRFVTLPDRITDRVSALVCERALDPTGDESTKRSACVPVTR